MTAHDPASCKGVCTLLSDLIERRVGWFDRLRMKYHLWRCPQCHDYYKQFECIYRATGAPEACELPDDFDDVMGKVLDKWLQSGGSESNDSK